MWFTEVLVALMLMGLLWTGVLAFGRSALGLVRVYEARREAIRTNILALDMFAREWRLAGYSATAERMGGILAPTGQSVEFRADFDGDGTTSGFHERIAYYWDAPRQAVMRSTQDASPQPWLPKVPEGGFVLTYLDDTGQSLPPENTAPELIAGVRLSIQTRWEEPLPQPVVSSRFLAIVVVGRRNR